ncbi:hypothetical protein FRC08_002422 [Ceratobasidium sp. 394]|nr:hypothetical protein FRC08_002422 [Ceratobasidium sp. 394]
MSTTSSEIIDFVANDAVSHISSLIQDKLFGDALEKMTDFFETQVELKASVSFVLPEERVSKGVDPLMFYLEQFESHLKSAARGYPSNLDKFLRDAADANNGVHERLNKLYSSVIGQPGTKIQGNVLDIWHVNAFEKLSDVDQVDYCMVDYVDEIDGKLCLQMGQENGRTPRHRIRKLSTRSQAPNPPEWCFEYVHDHSTLLTLWLPNVPFVFPSKEYHKGTKYTKWKFDPPLDDGAVGLNCKSRRAALLELKPDFEPGKTVERSFSMEEAAEMVAKGKSALFKIAPVVDLERPDAALVRIREVETRLDVWGTWILSVLDGDDY